MSATQLPGVKVGPLDPDRTADFGQVSKGNTARQLTRLHAQMHPPALTAALARKLDDERTKTLVIDEVRGYLLELERENGDPVIPEGAVIEGAQVRGERDRPQVLTFTFRQRSGRTAKWFAPYEPADLPESADAGDELVRLAELREQGLPPSWDSEGASTAILRRENAGLRRQVDVLRDSIEHGSSGELPDEVPGDTRPDVQVVADNEQLRAENVEMRERLAALEAALGEKAAGELSGGSEPDVPPAAQDEPVEGYDELNAKDVISRLKAEDTPAEEVERILAYESTHQNRRSVVGAANQVLDRS